MPTLAGSIPHQWRSGGPVAVSLVVPCHCEEAALPELFTRLTNAALSWGETWEVILVDDGSSDRTWELICRQHELDERFVGVRLSRNFGHQAALSAGLTYASGRCVALLDADLQDPPELIGQFLVHWREGYQVVYAIRRHRKEGWLKRAAYHAFYRLLRRIADTNIPLDSGDFCLIDRTVVDVLNRMPERHRFLRGLRAWAGFRCLGIEYERAARAAGASKYTFGRLLILALDGLVSCSVAPLRAATYSGVLISVLTAIGVVFTLVQRLFAAQFARIGLGPVPGFATIVMSILFLGGIQLIVLGILGEYVARVYEEVKGRPLWIVWETAGLEPPSAAGLSAGAQRRTHPDVASR